MKRLSLLFAACALIFSGCNRLAKQKDRYYDTYYHPAGTQTPLQSVSK